jgi:hypothetical protein
MCFYHKDRLKNLVFLSLSFLQNGPSYFGEETQVMQFINDAKLRSGIGDLRWNKHQLLHRITSVKTPLIYNISPKVCQRLNIPLIYWWHLTLSGDCLKPITFIASVYLIKSNLIFRNRYVHKKIISHIFCLILNLRLLNHRWPSCLVSVWLHL